MRLHHLLLLSLWLILAPPSFGASCAADPGGLDVTVSGNYAASSIGSAAPYVAQAFVFRFQSPQCPTSVVTQADGQAFVVTVPGQYTNNGTTITVFMEVGYFHYSSGYQGIDIRLHSVFAAQDMLQIIVPTGTPLYLEPAQTPEIIIVTMANLSGGAYYYDPLSNTRIDSQLSSVTYSALPLTTQGAVGVVMADVQALLETGVLTTDQASGLMDKLTAAISSLNRGNTKSTCGQMKAFRNQVDAFINSGILTPVQGQALIQAAQVVNTKAGCT